MEDDGCRCERWRGIICAAHCKAPETGCRDGWHGDRCIGPVSLAERYMGMVVERIAARAGVA